LNGKQLKFSIKPFTILSSIFNMRTNPYTDLLPTKESPPNEADIFLVCAIFTSSYAFKATKLETSLKKFRIPYSLYQIPSIHSSISRHGSNNSPFNKPKFIMEMLNKYKRGILYLDIDIIVESEPFLIGEIAKKGYDFAIFNWLSKERNDAYGPVYIPGYKANRFYGYTHGIFEYDETQLICSGAVQFYGNTEIAKLLLIRWDATIEENPHVADDVSMNFTFNNKIDRSLLLAYWLPKSYARYIFWIFDKPVINHPDMPDNNTQFQQIQLKKGEHLFNMGSALKKPRLYYIQPKALLDLQTNQIFSFENGILLKIGENKMPIYIEHN